MLLLLMLLLTILALKKIIGTFVYTTDVDHQPHVSHPIKSFATPSSSPQALHSQSSSSLSVFQSVFYFLLLFCSWFFRWKLPVSVSTTSSNTITSLSNSASCPYSTASFVLLFFCCFPLLSFILPFLFGFFCLPFFVVHLNVLVTV